MRRVAFLLISPLVLAAALLYARRVATSAGETTLYWDDDARREVQAIVERRYVDPLDAERSRKLYQGALQGYVSRLDPFSRYVAPEDRKRQDEETQGTFGGIGVRASPVPAGLQVTAVREGAPADRGGVLPGDVIERVDGESVTGRDIDQTVGMLRGEPGTKVALDLRRDGAALALTVERALVPSDTVPAVRIIPGDVAVGYVRVEQFADTTAHDVGDALASLRNDGARAVILDLRQNLGGVVHGAVDVASLLLPEGTVVCVVRRREGGEIQRTKRFEAFEPTDLPLVLLVDEQTASASEILSGALQDHGRAVLVGERTWGKFLVQTLVETRSEGSIVRLTTARYETPRGRSAPRDDGHGPMSGLQPDVRVPLAATAERDALRLTFAAQLGPHWKAMPRAAAASPDRALDAALTLVRGGPAPATRVPVRAL